MATSSNSPNSSNSSNSPGHKFLDKYYLRATGTPGDIFEHLPTLVRYSAECSSVVECGVCEVVSTWAFLKGLTQSEAENKTLVSIDLYRSKNLDLVELISPQIGVDFNFLEGSDTKVPLEEADLYFIDTWHVYGHLKRELEIMAPLAKKYIIMHDTTVDEWHGETLRRSWDPIAQSVESGYPVGEITKGLWPAVEEFLESHKEWVLHERYTNNNGLTILRRV